MIEALLRVGWRIGVLVIGWSTILGYIGWEDEVLYAVTHPAEMALKQIFFEIFTLGLATVVIGVAVAAVLVVTGILLVVAVGAIPKSRGGSTSPAVSAISGRCSPRPPRLVLALAGIRRVAGSF